MKNYGLTFKGETSERTIRLMGRIPPIFCFKNTDRRKHQRDIISRYMPGRFMSYKFYGNRATFVIEIEPHEDIEATENFMALIDDIHSNNLLEGIWSRWGFVITREKPANPWVTPGQQYSWRPTSFFPSPYPSFGSQGRITTTWWPRYAYSSDSSLPTRLAKRYS